MTGLAVHPVALTRWRHRRGDILRRVLTPPERLTISQWADRYRRLSPESSAEPGPWQTERVPYLRGVMDAMSDPMVEQVVFMKSARVGGTEGGNNMLGYFIDRDPCPILVIQPTVEMAKAWSKEQLAPMLRDTPTLKGKVKDPKSRESGNAIQQKRYPGGVLSILGANSGAGFRMRSVRVFFGSEVDAWPESAGTEGDPVELGINRTNTFGNRKIYLESTPLLKGFSRIEPAFLEGDQRHYHVPCPHCGHFQRLIWANLRFTDLPAPMYACAGCGELIPEVEKYEMVRKGRWVASADFHGIASFHINALYAGFDGAKWSKLADRFVRAQGDLSRLQTFVNTVLGETWEERGGTINADLLRERREHYDGAPGWVEVLTAAVDVQDDRLEVKVKGWGPGLESALIARGVLPGDPAKAEVWRDCDRTIFAEYRRADGTMLKVQRFAVDTGGHFTEESYAYVRARRGRGAIAVKGSSQDKAPLLPRRPSVNNKGKVPLYVVGTTAAKDTIFARLRLTEPGPGYMHFPEWADDNYLEQLTAEKVVRRQINGRWVRRYVLRPNTRNEALDLEVYNLVALELTGARPRLLAMPSRQVAGETPATPAESTPEAPSGTPKPTLPNPFRLGRRGGRHPW